MRKSIVSTSLLAAGAIVLGVACKPRQDDAGSEAKSVNAFSYDGQGDPKQFLVFIWPESERSISAQPLAAQGNKKVEAESAKQAAPLSVSDVVAAFNAGSLPQDVLDVFPKVDPCTSTATTENVVYLECSAPVEEQYCSGRYRALSKDQYLCFLMKQLGQQKLLPNPGTLKMLEQQIAAMNKAKSPTVAAQITNITERAQKLTQIMQTILDLEFQGVNFVPMEAPNFQMMQGPFIDEKRYSTVVNQGWGKVTSPQFDFAKNPAFFQCVAKHDYTPHKGQAVFAEDAQAEACRRCGSDRNPRYDSPCKVACGEEPGADPGAKQQPCP